MSDAGDFDDHFGDDGASLDDEFPQEGLDQQLEMELGQEDDALMADEAPEKLEESKKEQAAPLNFRKLAGDSKAVPPDQRQTSKYMTKYEKARILGTRALQISKNAPILVTPGKDVSDPLEIAEQQLREKKLPFIVRRNLPGGYYEDWKVDELIVE